MVCTLLSKEALAEIGDWYDSAEHLVYKPVPEGVPAEEKIFAHYIHESIEYALYLLDTEPAKNKKKINEIIRAVLKNQNIENASEKYGNWEYFLEKDVQKRHYKVIRNDVQRENGRMAVSIVQILMHYREWLYPEICEKLTKSLVSTIYAFEAGDYESFNMNAVLTQVYPMYGYIKICQNGALAEIARKKLDKLYYATLNSDTFYEFNDMTAFVYNSELMSAIMRDIDDRHCLKCCRYLYEKHWKDMSENFHRYTMQLAGPFMSSSDTLEIYDFLDEALSGRLLKRGAGERKYMSKCPGKYVNNFIRYGNNKFEQKLISNGLLYPFFRHAVAATTYMQDKYTFGTFNREKFWENRRLFIGYFGNGANPYSFKLDVLHDGRSYASAVNHCVQCNGSALGHITFITDGGDRHLNDDAPNPTLHASDFRIRFSVSGNIGGLDITEEDNGITLKRDGVKICYRVPYFNFDKHRAKVKCTKTEKNLYFDVILVENEKKVLDFTLMKSAILEYNFLITGKDRDIGEPDRTYEINGLLFSKLVTEKFTLALNTPVRPGKEIECLTADKQFINGIRVEKQVAYREKIKDSSKFVKTLFAGNDAGNIDEGIIETLNSMRDNSFSENCECIEAVLDGIQDSGYDNDTKRKIMILLLGRLFEAATKYNFQLEKMINKYFNDIYQRRIFTDTPAAVRRDILKGINALKNIESNTVKSRSVAETVEECKNFVCENLLSPELSIEFVSGKLGCSPGYLSRIFHTYTNMRYVDYVQSEKIAFAVYKIQESGMTVKEVSEMLGYSSPNNFMRMFKKVKGKTVGEYIKN